MPKKQPFILSDEEHWARATAELARQREAFLANYAVNPGPRGLVKLASSSADLDLRGVIWSSSIYWWDAYYATHNDGVRWLDISRDEWQQLAFVEMHGDTDGRLYFTAMDQGQYDALIVHPTLKHALGEDGYLKLRVAGRPIAAVADSSWLPI